MTPEERKKRIHNAVLDELNGEKEVDSRNLGFFDEVPDHVRVQKKKNPKVEKGNKRDALTSLFLIIALTAVLFIIVRLLTRCSA